MSRSPSPLLALVLGLVSVLGSGCVVRALAYGGAHARGPSARPSAAGVSTTTLACRPRFWGYGSVCRGTTTNKSAPPARAPVLLAAGAEPIHQKTDGRLEALTSMRGGHLEVRGQPAKYPTRALLALRPSRALPPGPCAVRLFRDGVELTIFENMRASDHEVRVAIDVTELRQLQEAVRFAGEACGREFELDEPARATLSVFEARFREQLTKRP